MTNPKIEKIKAEIERTKAAITDYQKKLREQEREKTRLENDQIVAFVRGERISDAELATLMQSFRNPATPRNEALQGGAGEPTDANVSDKSTRLEETPNANLDEN